MATKEYRHSSELYRLLINIDDLISLYGEVARTPSKRHILEAVAIDVEMISHKLKKMRNRWNQLLPFHEAIDVKFGEWAKSFEEWIETLKQPMEPISAGFLLDMVDEPKKELGDDLKKEVSEICQRLDRKLEEKMTNWEQKAYGEPLDELKAERDKVIEALEFIRDELNELEEFFNSELTEKQFKTLALRLYYRDCAKACKEAKNEVNKAHNSWPAKNVARRAALMKDTVKREIISNDLYKGLADYIDLDYPEMFDEAPFGQFLFMNRNQLQVEDVQTIVKMIETIQRLNGFIDPNGTQKQKDKRALGRELSADERQIVKTLLQMVERVGWRGGATATSIAQGINRMLGVGYALEGDLLEMSDDLWKLLKSRPRCDADKSLKVTWLNIVGWCVSKGYLSGSGSPALCKEFYPKAGDDDYKAIDKGRKEPSGAFKKIIPLLEKFLR